MSARLTRLAERGRGVLVPTEQDGFRRGRSAEENLARLIQAVQNGYKKPRPRGRPADGVTAEKCLLMAYDITRAYYVIGRRVIKLKLLRLGLPACLVR